jgi:MoxR-like ATPase
LAQNLFAFTAGDPAARAHLSVSISQPFHSSVLDGKVPSHDLDAIKQLEAELMGLYAWGAVPGSMNDRYYKALQVGDFVVCVFEARYRYVAKVAYKLESVDLAEALWGKAKEGKTWQYMFFLTKPVAIDIPLHQLYDYLPKQFFGFARVGDDNVKKIVGDFGSLENFVNTKLLQNSAAPAVETDQDNDSSDQNQYFIIRSNPGTAWGDAKGKSYRFGSTVPNYKKLLKGGYVLVDSKATGGATILGVGMLSAAVQVPPEGNESPTNTYYQCDYIDWQDFERPRPIPAELVAKIVARPGYNVQHAVRPVDRDVLELIVNYMSSPRQEFKLGPVTLFLNRDDVIGAFERVGIKRRGITGREPYWMIQHVDKAKPVSQVFRKLPWVDDDTKFNTRDAIDIFEKLGFVCFSVNHIEREIVESEEEPMIPFTIDDAMDELFIDRTEFEKALRLLGAKKNLILQGSPGVGKTFVAKRLAYATIGFKSESHIETVQFHQAYSYEDFIQGFRPRSDGSGFAIHDGVFHRFCESARLAPQEKFVFIVDEINRGNLGKIFGELLMLIEADKRSPAWGLRLAYSDETAPRFYVPENVHIIGMMNTADRSLTSIDYALRRRFAFMKVRPAFEHAAFTAHLESRGWAPTFAAQIKARFTELNSKIAADEELREGFCVGHSYFCGSRPPEMSDEDIFAEIIETEIQPLLEDYWFDKSVQDIASIVSKLSAA